MNNTLFEYLNAIQKAIETKISTEHYLQNISFPIEKGSLS